MADEEGKGHVGLKLVHSDLLHVHLICQLEAVLDVSPCALPDSQGLNV